MKLNKNKLELCLARKGMTKQELATISGVRNTSISHSLKNGASIYPHTVGKIADALGVDVAELIED